eukprot:scaffold828_cov117-Amphora_coffeaeformis.AAC.2
MDWSVLQKRCVTYGEVRHISRVLIHERDQNLNLKWDQVLVLFPVPVPCTYSRSSVRASTPQPSVIQHAKKTFCDKVKKHKTGMTDFRFHAQNLLSNDTNILLTNDEGDQSYHWQVQ